MTYIHPAIIIERRKETDRNRERAGIPLHIEAPRPVSNFEQNFDTNKDRGSDQINDLDVDFRL